MTLALVCLAAAAYTPGVGVAHIRTTARRVSQCSAILKTKESTDARANAKADAAKERLTKAAKFESAWQSAAVLEAESKTFKSGDALSSSEATLLDIVNVLGRWKSCEEWRTRTQFTEAAEKSPASSGMLGSGPKFDVAQQVGSRERYDMAQRLGLAERLAFQHNAPKLPFRDAALAESFGLSVRDFAEMPVDPAAVDIVYDALAQSKSGLISAKTIDERRKKFQKSDGSFRDGKFALGLYTARTLTGSAVLAKPALYGMLVFQMVTAATLSSGVDQAIGAVGSMSN